jgi:hypothetical protein
MVKKRATSRRHITNSGLAQIVADNHADAVERLARIEENLKGLPKRVHKLELWRSYLVGAWVAITLAIGSYLKLKGH